ncbi:MAG: S8 family serine peptidase [Thermoplasmata archaeon]|nr:MAG: S8 family serine peptidase [Thermoplasmata archaeon]
MAKARKASVLLCITMLVILPIVDLGASSNNPPALPDLSNLTSVLSRKLPEHQLPWWERTALDLNRNKIHDSLDLQVEEDQEQDVDVYLDYEEGPSLEDIYILEEMDLEISYILQIGNAIGLSNVPLYMIPSLADLDGVVMVEPKGTIRFYSDIATPTVKAKESELYSPNTAWELGYTGYGGVIAIMDTGVDNGHPSFSDKWVGGADFTKPETFFTPRDGTYDADDVQGHGTTCAGIAMGTGAPDGVYQGTSPDAKLVDLRIGTIMGASPGEGPESVYDAALEATEWAIEHHADQWAGQPEEYHGIDALSLSWGIPYEGSSDGSDLYSQTLNRLVDVGVLAVVAAGNDGPDNDGFTGMGAADNVITVAATDDLDTIDRSDDIIAEYSSRGPRWDDGDGNPYDELKPDVASPGTGITNAEYDRYGDGSGNGYGPRGSGTSYAAPNVVGVVALILEANPDLTPDLVKEILHFTSERKGNATFPELDPFWNRDFGYGIVDSYEAVRVAEKIVDVEVIDVNLQCFIMEISNTSSRYVDISGIAWSQNGEVEVVEIRIDDGEWVEAKDMSNGTWSKWTYRLNQAKLGKGNHTFEARAVAGDKYSLQDEESVLVAKTWKGDESEFACLPGLVILILVAGVAGYLLFFKGRKNEPENKGTEEIL